MTPLELQEPVVEEKHVEEEKPVVKKSKNNGNKWLGALYVTILFLVVSMPVTYKFTNALLKGVCVLASKNGCPTICGILVHALVFLLLLRLGYEFVPMREGAAIEKKKVAEIKDSIDEIPKEKLIQIRKILKKEIKSK
tara:strand:- start:229 stop:642 length:414 start_codon:yes stop_codon:yes gene_type:complete